MINLKIVLRNGRTRYIGVTDDNYYEIFLLIKRELEVCRKGLRKLKDQGLIKDIRRFRLNKKTILLYNCRRSLLESIRQLEKQNLNTFV